MMDQAAKAKFILALHKHSLQAFDSGGTVLPQATTVGDSGGLSATINPVQGWGTAITNPTQSIANTGAAFQDMAKDFTAQNSYQAQLAPIDHTDYGGTIGTASGNALSGYNRAQSIQGQQQNLSDQLMAESRGGGPNPAQAQLAAATGQNVASQAALMAGQRGASANPGMIARQAAQQGATTQQQAISQAATLQAQQQLAAQQQLQAQQQAMASGNVAEQGVNSNLFGTAAGAQNTQNSNVVQNYNMAQGINSQIAQKNTDSVNKTLGGVMGGASSVLSMMAKGGMVSRYADGGDAGNVGMSASVNVPNMFASSPSAAASPIPQPKSPASSQSSPSAASPPSQSNSPIPPQSGSTSGAAASSSQPDFAGVMSGLAGKFAQGGNIEVSSHIGKLLKHGKFVGKLAATGGKVEAASSSQKAVKKDNSYSNDKIPALLSDGEIVLPRSITQHPMAPEKAAQFVQAVLNKRRMGKTA